MEDPAPTSMPSCSYLMLTIVAVGRSRRQGSEGRGAGREGEQVRALKDRAMWGSERGVGRGGSLGELSSMCEQRLERPVVVSECGPVSPPSV